MKLRAEIAGQRVLPIGISNGQIMMVLKPLLRFLAAGDRKETIDFYSVRGEVEGNVLKGC